MYLKINIKILLAIIILAVLFYILYNKNEHFVQEYNHQKYLNQYIDPNIVLYNKFYLTLLNQKILLQLDLIPCA